MGSPRTLPDCQRCPSRSHSVGTGEMQMPWSLETSDLRTTPDVRDPQCSNHNQEEEAKILGFRLQIRIILTNTTTAIEAPEDQRCPDPEESKCPEGCPVSRDKDEGTGVQIFRSRKRMVRSKKSQE